MKAEVLALARRRVCGAEVPCLVHFSVREWRRRPKAVLRRIAASVAGEVAVRSSARDEDRAGASRAGHYPSLLGVANEPGALATAIERVAAPLAGDLENRVLVQAMVRDVVASGVIVTRDPTTGAPYYVVEYDRSGRTDTVTGGLVLPAAAVVFRGTPLRAVGAAALRRLLRVTREVERWWRGAALELEFAITRDAGVTLLQVRRLTIAAGAGVTSTGVVATRLAGVARAISGARAGAQRALAGSRTILAQMSDWNPAELIGVHPSPLAASVFGALVSDDVWQRARASMGYRAVHGVPLMRLVAGRPYIDVRASFNSFLPPGLPDHAAHALVDAWLSRLAAHPELHDKVEFEVAQTAVDFAFRERYGTRFRDALSARDFAIWADALRRLTTRAVTTAPTSSLRLALASARCSDDRASRRVAASEPLRRAFELLAACRRRGTLPFAIVARHAFIAETLLRSGVEREAWTAARLTAFRRSLTTVATELARDLRGVIAGRTSRARFLRRYGHVRPSSFDVASLRYDQRPELFGDVQERADDERGAEPFTLSARERRAFRGLAREAGLAIDPDELLRYAAAAIVGRERVKLDLTRLLSDALECLAKWGAAHDLARADVACLTLADLRRARRATSASAAATWGALVAARRAARDVDRAVRLSPLIRDAADLYVPPVLAALPTFVTTRTVVATPVALHGGVPAVGVARRVVCIESADPGFDWIFAHRIAALVTRFGGGNSHMAVRCVEADVPAAIGVGEELFERLRRALLVELRCAERLVRAL
ncbi:MAG: pyruvate, phosphate dikinase [Deltaproteobacteria bacterium]|nr:pyruvate, phosphate dikinase [Deltaproteobacteria bacterium]